MPDRQEQGNDRQSQTTIDTIESGVTRESNLIEPFAVDNSSEDNYSQRSKLGAVNQNKIQNLETELENTKKNIFTKYKRLQLKKKLRHAVNQKDNRDKKFEQIVQDDPEFKDILSKQKAYMDKNQLENPPEGTEYLGKEINQATSNKESRRPEGVSSEELERNKIYHQLKVTSKFNFVKRWKLQRRDRQLGGIIETQSPNNDLKKEKIKKQQHKFGTTANKPNRPKENGKTPNSSWDALTKNRRKSRISI